MRLLMVAATVLAAAVVVAACGGESDESQIEGVVASFFDATKEKDVAKFCDVVITDELPGACEDQVSAEDFTTTGDFEGFEVNDIEVDGDTATASVTGQFSEGEDMTEQLSLRKLDGEWKIDFEE